LTPRQTKLARELGRLLTKYNARDWQLLGRLLTAKPELLSSALSSLEAASSKVEKPRSKKRSGPSTVAKKPRVAKPKRRARSKAKEKQAVEAARERSHDDARRSLSRASVSHLQALYLHFYRDNQVPKSRSELTGALEKHLHKLPDNERARVLRSVTKSDPTDTYRRWVDIISKKP
jgi:hypothetical protein